MAPGVLIGVPLLLALVALRGATSLPALRRRVRNAWSDIEVQLGSRRDLVERLVETVKGTAPSEPEALDALRKAGRQAVEARGIPARAAAENQLSEALRCFFAVAACADLEDNPSVRAVQAELAAAEDRIASTRRSYNNHVMAWNVRIARFPWSLVSRPAGLHPAEYFVMDEPATERKQQCSSNG